jgi:DNA-binding transcriptional LysR family regulator
MRWKLTGSLVALAARTSSRHPANRATENPSKRMPRSALRVQEGDGAASALAFVAAGFGVAVFSEAAAENTRQGCDFPRSGSRG